MSSKATKRARRKMRVIKLRQQGGKCAYCWKSLTPENVTGDHIIPESTGGKYQWRNIIAVCRKCNNARGNTHRLAFQMTVQRRDYARGQA